MDHDDDRHDRANQVQRVTLKKVDDSGEQQLVDVDGRDGVSPTEVLRIQPFGFTSNPPAGSEGIMITIASGDTPMVVGLESPSHRPKGDPSGSSRQYDAAGSAVYMDGEGNVKIECSGTLTLKAGTKVKIEGDIDHDGDNTQDGVHVDSNGPHTA